MAAICTRSSACLARSTLHKPGEPGELVSPNVQCLLRVKIFAIIKWSMKGNLASRLGVKFWNAGKYLLGTPRRQVIHLPDQPVRVIKRAVGESPGMCSRFEVFSQQFSRMSQKKKENGTENGSFSLGITASTFTNRLFDLPVVFLLFTLAVNFCVNFSVWFAMCGMSQNTRHTQFTVNKHCLVKLPGFTTLTKVTPNSRARKRSRTIPDSTIPSEHAWRLVSACENNHNRLKLK